MNSELKTLDLIDLISERHLQLRSIAEGEWNEESDIHISNSEWFIMARIYKKNPSVSQVTRRVDISRQAVHKFAKGLQAKGLVEITDSRHNKRDKCLMLTQLGKECYEKNLLLKKDLEMKIAEEIGLDTLNTLKRILVSNWGIREY
ncbi:MarR family winged helix-turn-helix transcriptional regulator [Gudongella sp. SC589]|uniref:MarR family winged helix-turn-helix transcriptional regulator n=1 Tax=Gudongella sp. SC589 TaxID=3385990 RepID=UPI003904A61B